MRLTIMVIWAALAGACNQQVVQNQPAANAPAPAIVNEVAPEPTANPAAPRDRTSLAEPKGPIDPKSVEAAGQVVQSYGALIEQKRFAEATKLWRDETFAQSFIAPLRKYPEVHLEIGKPGEPEGAAGSIYVTEPVTFYGKDEGGKALRRAADVILRRVNDVPGSTAAQRRWHIEQVEWKDAA